MARKNQLQLVIVLLASKIVVTYTSGLPNLFQSDYFYHLCTLISRATYIYLLIFLYQVVHIQENQTLSINTIRILIGITIFDFFQSLISAVWELETLHNTMLKQLWWSLPSSITLVCHIILSIQLLKNNSLEYNRPIRLIGISFLLKWMVLFIFFPLLTSYTDFSMYLYRYYIPETLNILPFAAMIYFYKSILNTLEFSSPESPDQHIV